MDAVARAHTGAVPHDLALIEVHGSVSVEAMLPDSCEILPVQHTSEPGQLSLLLQAKAVAAQVRKKRIANEEIILRMMMSGNYGE